MRNPFVDRLFVWVKRRDLAIGVRVVRLEPGEADELKRMYSGHIGGGGSQWEVQGRNAVRFLADQLDEIRLIPEPRE